MQVRLLRDARIRHRAGEVVEVTDPAELGFLLNTGTAETVRTAPAPAVPETKAEKPAEKPAAKPAAKPTAKPAAKSARKTAK